MNRAQVFWHPLISVCAFEKLLKRSIFIPLLSRDTTIFLLCLAIPFLLLHDRREWSSTLILMLGMEGFLVYQKVECVCWTKVSQGRVTLRRSVLLQCTCVCEIEIPYRRETFVTLSVMSCNYSVRKGDFQSSVLNFVCEKKWSRRRKYSKRMAYV